MLLRTVTLAYVAKPVAIAAAAAAAALAYVAKPVAIAAAAAAAAPFTAATALA